MRNTHNITGSEADQDHPPGLCCLTEYKRPRLGFYVLRVAMEAAAVIAFCGAVLGLCMAVRP